MPLSNESDKRCFRYIIPSTFICNIASVEAFIFNQFEELCSNFHLFAFKVQWLLRFSILIAHVAISDLYMIEVNVCSSAAQTMPIQSIGI